MLLTNRLFTESSSKPQNKLPMQFYNDQLNNSRSTSFKNSKKRSPQIDKTEVRRLHQIELATDMFSTQYSN